MIYLSEWNRTFTLILFAFTLGACAGLWGFEINHSWWLGLCALIPLLARRNVIFISSIVFMIGLYWSWSASWSYQQASMDFSAGRQEAVVIGKVEGLPEVSDERIRFELRLIEIESGNINLEPGAKLRLNWYRRKKPLQPGEIWRLKVRLKPPLGLKNPTGFDYERWLKSRHINAIGYVKQWEQNQLIDRSSFGSILDMTRSGIGDYLETMIEQPRAAGLIKALSIGDRSGLTQEDWRIFTATGTNHLVAISGLHVGMIAAWFMLFGAWLWRRSEVLMLIWPSRRAAACFGLFGAFGYAALAGFSLPTQRALVMLTLALGALVVGRTLSVERSLVLALTCVILLDPFSPMSPGFWLSFGAVVLILYGLLGRWSRPGRGSGFVRIQWLVVLGLSPLTLLFFDRASAIAPVVNLLLIPWFSLVMVPMVFMSLPLSVIPVIGEIWLVLTEQIAELTLSAISVAAETPFASFEVASLPFWILLLALLGVLILLMPKGMPGRWLGLILILPLITHKPARPEPGEVWLTVLDVGQGLSIVAQTQRHTLVYDTGPSYPSGFNAGETVVLPYLRGMGVHQLDLVILSNGDQDHSGGFQAIRSVTPVNRLLMGGADPVDDAMPCRMGDHWRWDGVDFKVLHPQEGDQLSHQNDASCVLLITNGLHSVLIPGDVEYRSEQLLIERYAADLQADLVIAPHHGSKTSSSPVFVRHTQPDYVAYSTGYANRYRFPHEVVTERWSAVGAKSFNTAVHGALIWRISPDESLVDPEVTRH